MDLCLIAAIFAFSRSDFDAWVKDAATTLPMVGAGGTVTVTPNQLGTFLNAMAKAQEADHVKWALKSLARLYI